MNLTAPLHRGGRCFFACTMLATQVGVAGQLNVTVNDTEGHPLSDAVVYALPKNGGALPAARPAQIDQKDRMFVPMVSVIQTGASVSFPNSDNIRHQVYSFSPAKTFNLKLYSGKPANPIVFDKSGAVVLGCNIHDQMVAWVLVVDTPWFGKSEDNGKTSLKLPDGEYEVHLWHPSQHAEATAVAVNINGDLNKTLSIDATALSHHAH